MHIITVKYLTSVGLLSPQSGSLSRNSEDLPAIYESKVQNNGFHDFYVYQI